MPYYGHVYRLEYTNVEEQFITIDITDNDSASIDPIDTVYHMMEGAEVASQAETSNNEEDKLSTIRAKAINIDFLSTGEINLNTFRHGTDDRWQVHKYSDSQTIFNGFLILDELSEDFQDPPNVVSLVAADNIGTLREIPLTKPDGTNPSGKYKIIEYISWCLQKTGLQLPIYTVHNIMEEDYVGLPMWNNIYLDAKTFEDEVGSCIDCYEALNRIFKEDCFVTQQNGVWWIERPDEVGDGEPIYVHRYDYLGTFVSSEAGTTLNQTIEMNGEIFFSQEGALVHSIRANKKLILTYNYDYPKEILCNIDIERGAEFVIPITIIPLTGYTTYELECWETLRGFGSGATTPNDWAVIARKFDEFGHETERFIVLTKPILQIPPANYIRSEPVRIAILDKFNFSFDYSALTDNNVTGPNTITIAMIVLYGDDGSVWVLSDATTPPKWLLSNVDLSVNADTYKWIMYGNLYDLTEWQNFSIESAPAPVTGDLRIHLFAANQGAGAADDFDIRYQNLQFTYMPLIRGSYQTYKGQQHIITANTKMKAVRENEIYISDSPKELFKGAMFKKNAYTTFTEAALIFDIDHEISFPGDLTAIFTPGLIFKIQGTVSNDGFFTVVNSVFTTNTTVTVIEATTAEIVDAEYSTGSYTLTGRFYNGAVIRTTPDEEFLHPFGHIQAFAVWNMINREFVNFEFTAQGLRTDTDEVPDMIHKYLINDVSQYSNNKQFMLLHYSQNFVDCEWNGVLAEVYDTTIPKVYDDEHQFKYITER